MIHLRHRRRCCGKSTDRGRRHPVADHAGPRRAVGILNLQTQMIAGSVREVLFDAEIAFGRLNRRMSQ